MKRGKIHRNKEQGAPLRPMNLLLLSGFQDSSLGSIEAGNELLNSVFLFKSD